MSYTKKEKTVNPVVKTENITTVEDNIEMMPVEEVKQEVKQEVKEESKKKQRVFNDTDPIVCTSITSGRLGMTGIKSGINYKWSGRGDETEVEYQDLVAAIRSGKKHITEPYFVINDEEFLNKFPQIKDIYGAMYSIGDLRKVITDLDANSMKLTIENLPNGAKDSIKNIAASMISNRQLDSVQKIRTLDEIYDTKFMLMTELFE